MMVLEEEPYLLARLGLEVDLSHLKVDLQEL
jgi:hypothetical protein